MATERKWVAWLHTDWLNRGWRAWNDGSNADQWPGLRRWHGWGLSQYELRPSVCQWMFRVFYSGIFHRSELAASLCRNVLEPVLRGDQGWGNLCGDCQWTFKRHLVF